MTAGTLNPSMLMKMSGAMSMNLGTKTGDADGDAGVDCRGFEWALIIMPKGTIASGGNGKYVVKSSSDDGVADAYAAISGAEHALSGTDDNTWKAGQIRLQHHERYVRVDYDETATGSSAVTGAIVIPFGPRSTPEWQDTTAAFTVI